MLGNKKSLVAPKLFIISYGIEHHDFVFLDDPPIELSVFGTREVTDNSIAFYFLHNYFNIFGKQLYDEPFHDLLTNDFQPRLASARMLGRQMDKILDESSRVRNKILEILPKLLKWFTDIEIDQLYKANQSDIQIVGFRMVVEVIKGINDGSINS